jgi:hypothetical protein
VSERHGALQKFDGSLFQEHLHDYQEPKVDCSEASPHPTGRFFRRTQRFPTVKDAMLPQGLLEIELSMGKSFRKKFDA